MSIFKEVDFAAIGKELTSVKENVKSKREFVEVPYGEYVVKLHKVELRESKKGQPMVMFVLKVEDGEFEGEFITKFQLLTLGFQFKMLYSFLDSFQTGVKIDPSAIQSEDDLRFLLADIQTVTDTKLFTLVYGENMKGFKEHTILEYTVPF